MSYQGLPPLEVADMLLEPTERDRAAANAIRHAMQMAEHWRSMADVRGIQIDALQAEVRRLKRLKNRA